MYILFSAVWDLKKKKKQTNFHFKEGVGYSFSLNIPTIPMALDRKDE